MKVNTAYVCRHSLVQTPERQNQCHFNALIVNFGQISHLVFGQISHLVPCKCRLHWILTFLVMFCIQNKKKQRRISDPQIIYDGALCGNIMSGSHFVLTKQLQLRWWMNRRAVSICYYFTYWYLLSFLGARNIIYCFLCWETVVLVFW